MAKPTHTAAFEQRPVNGHEIVGQMKTRPVELFPGSKHDSLTIVAQPHGGFVVMGPVIAAPPEDFGRTARTLQSALASFTDAESALKWMGENIARPAAG